MSIKIPKRIEIASHEIDVVFIDDNVLNAECFGGWERHTNQIYIRKDLPESRGFVVFLHECLHAISDFHKLELDEDKRHSELSVLAEEMAKIFKQLKTGKRGRRGSKK